MSQYTRYPPTGGGGGGSGTVTSVSVVSANGLAGSVANATTTPAITLRTSITGVLKGNGTAIGAATAGTDYSVGTASLATGLLKSTTASGALSIAVSGTDYQPAGSYANLSGGNSFTGAQAFGDGVISRFSGSINNQTGTTYTVNATDNGGVITLSNASTITLTVPNSLVIGFNCLLIQIGAGQVTIAAGAGATVNNRLSNTKIAGQYGVATLFVYANAGGSSAIALTGGDMTT